MSQTSRFLSHKSSFFVRTKRFAMRAAKRFVRTKRFAMRAAKRFVRTKRFAMRAAKRFVRTKRFAMRAAKRFVRIKNEAIGIENNEKPHGCCIYAFGYNCICLVGKMMVKNPKGNGLEFISNYITFVASQKIQPKFAFVKMVTIVIGHYGQWS